MELVIRIQIDKDPGDSSALTEPEEIRDEAIAWFASVRSESFGNPNATTNEEIILEGLAADRGIYAASGYESDSSIKVTVE